jgi:Flp pilus assembly protein TadG
MYELALTLPILLLMVTGIYSIGIFLAQYIELTDAVNAGAMWLSVNRNKTLDPCNLTYTAVVNAAPFLKLDASEFSYSLDGNAESGSSCSSPNYTTGAPSYMVQGQPVTVTVTYPCTLFDYWGALIPQVSCTMSASLTEIMQ